MGLAVHIFYPEVDVFGLVARFHSKFSSDPDLDGCLLELEEILKLKAKSFIGSFVADVD